MMTVSDRLRQEYLHKHYTSVNYNRPKIGDMLPIGHPNKLVTNSK